MAAPGTRNGWYSLVDIVRENRERQQEYVQTAPAACPNDGEPLEYDPQGRLRCHFDGWIYRG